MIDNVLTVGTLIDLLKNFPRESIILTPTDDDYEGINYRTIVKDWVEPATYIIDNHELELGPEKLTLNLENQGFTQADIKPYKCVLIG